MYTFPNIGKKKDNAAPSIVGTGGINAASAQKYGKYGHIVWLAEKGTRVHGRERGMSLKEKKTNGAGNVSVHHFTNPLDGTDGESIASIAPSLKDGVLHSSSCI